LQGRRRGKKIRHYKGIQGCSYLKKLQCRCGGGGKLEKKKNKKDQKERENDKWKSGRIKILGFESMAFKAVIQELFRVRRGGRRILAKLKFSKKVEKL